jgi:hypothetical protein
MKAISVLLLLAGLASIVLSVLMKYIGLDIFGVRAASVYLILANTFILLSLAVNSLRK